MAIGQCQCPGRQRCSWAPAAACSTACQSDSQHFPMARPCHFKLMPHTCPCNPRAACRWHASCTFPCHAMLAACHTPNHATRSIAGWHCRACAPLPATPQPPPSHPWEGSSWRPHCRFARCHCIAQVCARMHACACACTGLPAHSAVWQKPLCCNLHIQCCNCVPAAAAGGGARRYGRARDLAHLLLPF